MNFYKQATFFIIFLGYSFIGVAQREMSIWYLDFQNGFDFNFTPPLQIHSPALKSDYQDEKAVMADKYGHLLFYSDSWQVFNADHTLMENGHILDYPNFGATAHSKNVMIVPRPGYSNEYYLISSHIRMAYFDNNDAYEFLHYAIVDLSGGNTSRMEGKGSFTDKMIILEDSMRNFGIFRGIADQHYWLVAVGNDLPTRIFVYKIAKENIFKVWEYPVHYSTGTIIKGTPDGKFLLLSLVEEDVYDGIKFYKIDSITGELNEDMFLPIVIGEDIDVFREVIDYEISADSRYLYTLYNVMKKSSPFDIEAFLYKYDLSLEDPESIIQSGIKIYNFTEFFPNTIQINWKGEMVISNSSGYFLSMIKSPCSTENIGFNYHAVEVKDPHTSYYLNSYPPIYPITCPEIINSLTVEPEEKGINIFPNPSNGWVTIKTSGNDQWMVMDISGRFIRALKSYDEGRYYFYPGFYQIRSSSGNTAKLIIK